MSRSSKLITLEENVRFSESKVWELQRRYYASRGVAAWEEVPLWITSNPYITQCYAEVTVHFILDLVRRRKHDPSKPVYVLELGTGAGKFSYLCMQRIFALQEALGLSKVEIVYVMSDFTRSNLRFWKKHSQFREFVESSRLDFAIFDMVKGGDIRLEKRGVKLGPRTVKHPLIVFANYIFDTIPHDAFGVKKGCLQEGTVRLKTKAEAMRGKKEDAVGLGDVRATFQYRNIDGGYYGDPAMDGVLDAYAETLDDVRFLFPVASLASLRHLMKLSGDRLLVIATDKGCSLTGDFRRKMTPSITRHGSISVMVNFHAMSRFFENCGGEAWTRPVVEDVTTSIFLVGDSLKRLPFTRHAVATWLDHAGPGEVFSQSYGMTQTKQPLKLATMISYLKLSHWDPGVLRGFFKRIMAQIGGASQETREAVKAGLREMESNLFEMSGAGVHHFEMAALYYTLGEPERAIAHFHRAEKELGEKKFQVLFNLGLCYHETGNRRQALRFLRKAAALKNSTRVHRRQAEEWVARLEGKQRE